MGIPAVGVKPILVSMHLPPRTAARLAPLPKWAKITRPLAATVPATRASSSIRQAVETVPLNALCLEVAWNWQDSSNRRHIAMKGGVKARDLRQFGITLAEHFDQTDFRWQVSGS